MPLWSSSNPNSGDPYAPPNDADQLPLSAYKPLLKQLTFSSFMGYCSAVTAKKLGKGMAFIAGMGFMTLQGLAYTGIIDVNWKRIEEKVVDVVDADKDGEITEKDVQLWWEKVKKILTNNLPDASGFGFGFMYGLRG
mmetsp:Transcript_39340/g.82734  ORF Transcript_39340/g.82734 Transcript_39340/m.82734 type:complete len:137 (-) Transcript_39340:1482-1892(-)